MPYVRVKKKREKSLARRLKHQLRGGKGARPFSYYVYLLVAFIVALLVGMYLIRKAARVEPEQPVVSSMHLNYSRFIRLGEPARGGRFTAVIACRLDSFPTLCPKNLNS